MATKVTERELIEVDDFLQDQKTLLEPQPEWKNSPFPGEVEGRWTVVSSDGSVSSHLRFRIKLKYFDQPSISLIFRNNAIWRVDFAPDFVCKANPPDGFKFGLDAQVCGNHEHRWSDNRNYIENGGFKTLPYRRAINNKITRVSQAVNYFTSETNINLEPSQYSIEMPKEQELPF